MTALMDIQTITRDGYPSGPSTDVLRTFTSNPRIFLSELRHKLDIRRISCVIGSKVNNKTGYKIFLHLET